MDEIVVAPDDRRLRLPVDEILDCKMSGTMVLDLLSFFEKETSRIKLVFLPPYAPNLNLIERLWKFFKKQILYNRYFATFAEFQAACQEFFSNPSQYQGALRSLLTENFAIIGE